MESKELAQKIWENAGIFKEELDSIKKEVENLLLKIADFIKTTGAEIDSEDKFKEVLAHLIDKAVDIPILPDMAEYSAIKFIVDLIDKGLMDRFAGKDWFDRLILKRIKD